MAKRPDSRDTRIRKKIGQMRRWAMADDEERRRIVGAMHAGNLSKWLDQVDPERKLLPDDRERRAQMLRSAYFTELSLKRWTKERRAKAGSK